MKGKRGEEREGSKGEKRREKGRGERLTEAEVFGPGNINTGSWRRNITSREKNYLETGHILLWNTSHAFI